MSLFKKGLGLESNRCLPQLTSTKKIGQLHQFKRNFGALRNSWKTMINDGEVDYMSCHKLTGQLIRHLYQR